MVFCSAGLPFRSSSIACSSSVVIVVSSSHASVRQAIFNQSDPRPH
jgi:hypothetical protein